MTLELFLLAAAVILCALNGYATLRIWRDRLLTPARRVAQTVIVWAVPVIGALAALWFLREEKFELQRHEPPGPDRFHG
jgi:TRAP-type C4-dicarboxylate transport system permease small subunit